MSIKKLLLFPGQGSQSVGMGKPLFERYPSIQERFLEADEILGFKLSEVVAEGPEDKLKQTEYAQPAIYTYSAALFDVALKQGLIDADEVMVAGHSLGEFSAVYAAGGYSFEDGLRLVKRRSELMAEACHGTSGKMLAVVRLDIPQVEELVEDFCKEHEGSQSTLVVANINSPKQVVVSGDASSIDAFAEKLTAQKVRAVMLNVAGAFHSPLMACAMPGWKQALAETKFNALRSKVIVNVLGEPVQDGSLLPEFLERQLVSPVQWVKSMECAVASGCENGLEIGPGHVLAGLMAKIQSGFNIQSVEDTLKV